MMKFTVLTEDVLKDSGYEEAYTYSSEEEQTAIVPVLIYKRKGEDLYRVDKPEACKMIYIARAIYAILRETGKDRITIVYDNEKVHSETCFFDTECEWIIFHKLVAIEEEVFLQR